MTTPNSVEVPKEVMDWNEDKPSLEDVIGRTSGAALKFFNMHQNGQGYVERLLKQFAEAIIQRAVEEARK